MEISKPALHDWGPSGRQLPAEQDRQMPAAPGFAGGRCWAGCIAHIPTEKGKQAERPWKGLWGLPLLLGLRGLPLVSGLG